MTPAALGLGLVGAAVAYLAFRRTAAAASAGEAPLVKPAKAGPCGPWSGDGRAIQEAINAALAKASGEGKPQAVLLDGRPGAMTCRAAEWLRDTKQATPEILSFVVTQACGCGRARAPCGVSGPSAPQAVRDVIVAAAVAKGYIASDVNKGFQRESGWRPRAVNCQGADKHPVAGGMNQMIGSVLKAYGFHGSPDQFATLTAEEQLPYVLKFIKGLPPSTLHLPGDFGLAMFTPAYVGKPNDFVIYEVGSLGWQQNPGMRTAGGGPITAGSVRKTGA